MLNDCINQLKDNILEKDYVCDMKRSDFDQVKLDFIKVPQPVIERFELLKVNLELKNITINLDEIITDVIEGLNSRVAKQHDIDIENEYQRLKHPERLVRALPPEPNFFDLEDI